MNTKINLKWVYRVFFMLIAWYALFGHFVQIVVHRAPEATFLGALINYFSYFTIQSNWLVALWWVFAIFASRNANLQWFLSPKVKGALTVYITVTFSVYAVLLSSLYQPTGFDWLIVTITHYVTPLAFILDWILFEERGVYQWRYLSAWILYPVAYFAYAMIYGAITRGGTDLGWGGTVLGWGGMFLQVALLLVFFIALGSVYIKLNRLMKKPEQVQSKEG
ncbi:MAG: Pr6Pr family membrane protein [Anaerolineales bacterium]